MLTTFHYHIFALLGPFFIFTFSMINMKTMTNTNTFREHLQRAILEPSVPILIRIFYSQAGSARVLWPSKLNKNQGN